MWPCGGANGGALPPAILAYLLVFFAAGGNPEHLGYAFRNRLEEVRFATWACTPAFPPSSADMKRFLGERQQEGGAGGEVNARGAQGGQEGQESQEGRQEARRSEAQGETPPGKTHTHPEFLVRAAARLQERPEGECQYLLFAHSTPHHGIAKLIAFSVLQRVGVCVPDPKACNKLTELVARAVSRLCIELRLCDQAGPNAAAAGLKTQHSVCLRAALRSPAYTRFQEDVMHKARALLLPQPSGAPAIHRIKPKGGKTGRTGLAKRRQGPTRAEPSSSKKAGRPRGSESLRSRLRPKGQSKGRKVAREGNVAVSGQ